MSSFFSSNPLNTGIGQLIEKATDGSLASENWALNIEICDRINESSEGPKDAVRAIKKRLTSNVGKNYTVVMYTLTVLETCVKNCTKLHTLIANKDFLQELIKIIGPKNDPPQIVQEKVLSLIQTWADAFQGNPDLKEVGKVYMDLKAKGIEFPMTDLDHMAPIHTPARSMPGMDPPPPSQHGDAGRATQPMQAYPPVQQPYPVQPPAPQPEGPVSLSPDKLAKLHSELEVVRQNCKVFGDMLTELTPGQEEASDLELLQELNRTCRQMQHRIMELLETVSNEDVTEQLLIINDELNNAFLRYDRFERYRTGQTGQPQTTDISNTATLPIRDRPPAPLPAPVGQPRPPSTGDSGANLIDLDTPTPQATAAQDPFAQPANSSDIHLQLAGMNLGGNSATAQLGQINSTPAMNSAAGDDEFDMFAQSRQSFDQGRQNLHSGQNAYQNQQQDNYPGGLGPAVQAKTKVTDKEGDYSEMEKWLRQNDPTYQGQPQGPEGVTSSEFDRFLAERAREADSLPDAPSANQQGRSGRQIQKDDAENALFAL